MDAAVFVDFLDAILTNGNEPIKKQGNISLVR